MSRDAPLILSLALCMAASAGAAYGHGQGLDSIPSAEAGGRDVTVTVEGPMDAGAGPGLLVVTATEFRGGAPAKDLEYILGMHYQGELVFRERFLAGDGILSIETRPSETARILGLQDDAGSWYGTPEQPLAIEGPVLGDPGLYTFDIELLAPGEAGGGEIHRADLTVIEEAEFPQEDSEGAEVPFRTRSYFDRISNFTYNPVSRVVSFEMPFDWDDRVISHVPVVHEEVRFPKGFAEFTSVSYEGKVHGTDLFRSSVIIDDYSSDDERIVHFVLLADHLKFIKNQLREQDAPIPRNMAFELTMSNKSQFPLTAFTEGEEFSVNLSWEPPEILPGGEVDFVFTIRDGTTGEPLRNSEYDFVVIQSGEEIHRVSGKAVIGGGFERYEFDEEQTGPTIVRFEDIRGTGAETEFGMVVVPEFGVVLPALAAAMAGAAALGRRLPGIYSP
ncbi:hypothetical protein CENSYa_1799 [Cenarchaeum symbiosum A]|uniref:Secreted periplasmic Zn-dependent protease n=1 Tax=Cenarchaeum symbiosum (strain A) TaxID=414004 RepID=A0RYJ2_CENSY|nr:hypothetical protein CENSYa_1799 [Cenarchaeum symbiosum A]